jgi:uncharacterized protein
MKYFVEVKQTKDKGRGVFAMKNFVKGETIEECPIIFIEKNQDINLQKTILGKYVYEWTPETGAIILGYGSIYNHSFKPNAIYKRDFKNNLLIYEAYENISEGEEISVNYNGDPDVQKPVDDFIPVVE